MLDRRAVDHFSLTNEYKNRSGVVHSQDNYILEFLKEHSTSDSKILEIGGGSGALLDLIIKKSKINLAVNCEIVPMSYSNQINEEITLVGGDVLQLPFNDKSFDFVIMKNVLHHLVGINRNQSKQNAKSALEEIRRVSKDGANIIILEICNEHTACSDIIFYICKIFNKLKINLNLFDINKGVIVSFLTTSELMNICRDFDVFCSERTPMPSSIIYRYTLLMKTRSYMFLILGKRSAPS